MCRSLGAGHAAYRLTCRPAGSTSVAKATSRCLRTAKCCSPSWPRCMPSTHGPDGLKAIAERTSRQGDGAQNPTDRGRHRAFAGDRRYRHLTAVHSRPGATPSSRPPMAGGQLFRAGEGPGECSRRDDDPGRRWDRGLGASVRCRRGDRCGARCPRALAADLRCRHHPTSPPAVKPRCCAAAGLLGLEPWIAAIPLGSCTMKLNATTERWWPSPGGVRRHPPLPPSAHGGLSETHCATRGAGCARSPAMTRCPSANGLNKTGAARHP